MSRGSSGSALQPELERPCGAGGERRRYLASWFPFLPADRLRRQGGASPSGGPDERPFAVVEKVGGALRLAALDRRAAALGLKVGLTLADARARVPELAARAADPFADARFLEELALSCERFTPLVALDPPDGIVLDVTGCAHLFGGEAGLHGAAGDWLRRHGVGLRAALAGTPEAARAFARFSAHEVVPPAEEERLARLMPIAALGLPEETAVALARAGLRSLGDLAARPSAALAARFGQGLIARLRATLGLEDRRISPLRPPPECMAERHFPAPLMETAAIEEALKFLVADVAAQLERRGAGGRVFVTEIFRADGALRRIRVETGRPCRDVGTILRLYRERLEALADPLDPGFGFETLRLSVPAIEPCEAEAPGLSGEPSREGELAGLIDRLTARFGRDQVLRFQTRDSHDPLRQARAAPALDAVPAERRPLPPPPEADPGEPPLRPLRLFEPPQPIEAMAEVPDGPPVRFRWRRVLHEIARAEGPERIAPEWWRDEAARPARDYYRLEDRQGRRFWVFRQGFHGEEGGGGRWFLHGLFA